MSASNMLLAPAMRGDNSIRQVKYEVPQSTMTDAEYKASHGKWPETTLTTKSHDYTEGYIRRLVALRFSGKELDLKAMEETEKLLVDDLEVPGPAYLAQLLSWPVLDEEFADFGQNYLGSHSSGAARPYFRLVRTHLASRVRPLMEELSVDKYHVKAGYRGQPIGFWAKDDVDDVTFQYVHMIVRVMWRLWTDRSRHEVRQWLRDPAVVRNVDMQVYILYHAFLYKQVWAEEKERARILARCR